MLTPKDLGQNQIHGARLILKQRHLVFTPDCGFGKTVTSLTAATAVVKRGHKVLVVSTAQGVKGVWAKETLKWSHLRHMKVATLAGKADVRLQTLMGEADVYCISYNSLEWLSKQDHPPFFMVIADECSCLKGVESKWRAALSAVGSAAQIRVGMTATPKTRAEDDYWGICKWVDGGLALEETVGQFRARFMKSYTANNHTLWKMRNEAACQEVRELVKHLFVEYELPESAKIPVETHRVELRLSPPSQEIYDDFQRTGLVSMLQHDALHPTKPIGAMQIANKLATLSSGFMYSDIIKQISLQELVSAPSAMAILKSSRERVAVPLFTDRIKYLQKIIVAIHKKHGADRKICICYTFKYELEQLQRAFPTGSHDKDLPEAPWNAGKIPYLFLQYSRSSKSLNLQMGGNIMVMYSLTFRFEDDYQIIRRLARQGQPEDKVYLYILHLKGTLDDLKATRLGQRFKGHKAMQRMILKQYNIKPEEITQVLGQPQQP